MGFDWRGFRPWGVLAEAVSSRFDIFCDICEHRWVSPES